MFKILKKSLLFKDIDESQLESLLGCLTSIKKTFDKGEFILDALDPPTHVGIVLSGSASIIQEDFFGNRTILNYVEPGELFGEAFACSEVDELPISVVANEKADILFIDYKKIITTCTNSCAFHNKLIENMLYILAEKNISLTEKMNHLSKRTTREKLLSFFNACATKNKNASFDIPFNRQELADYLSIDRSALSRELSNMQEEGLIKYNKSHFELVYSITPSITV